MPRRRELTIYIEPSYEAGAESIDDLRLAQSIRDMGLLLAHSSRFYNQQITCDKDDVILRNYFMASLIHYPTRGERLRVIWESGVLDDGKKIARKH